MPADHEGVLSLGATHLVHQLIEGPDTDMQTPGETHGPEGMRFRDVQGYFSSLRELHTALFITVTTWLSGPLPHTGARDHRGGELIIARRQNLVLWSRDVWRS